MTSECSCSLFRAHGVVHLCECECICNAPHACFLHFSAHREWERVFTHKPCFQAVVWCNSIKSLKSVIYSYVSQLAHPEHEDFQVNLPFRQIVRALHWTLHSAHRAVCIFQCAHFERIKCGHRRLYFAIYVQNKHFPYLVGDLVCMAFW